MSIIHSDKATSPPSLGNLELEPIPPEEKFTLCFEDSAEASAAFLPDVFQCLAALIPNQMLLSDVNAADSRFLPLGLLLPVPDGGEELQVVGNPGCHCYPKQQPLPGSERPTAS